MMIRDSVLFLETTHTVGYDPSKFTMLLLSIQAAESEHRLFSLNKIILIDNNN